MYKTIKSMGQALSEARAYRDPKDEINENFDYAIIDGDNKIIGLYKGQDGKKHAQINMKGAETQVGVKKPLKIVPVRPHSKVKGDTVIGIGEETFHEMKKVEIKLHKQDIDKTIQKIQKHIDIENKGRGTKIDVIQNMSDDSVTLDGRGVHVDRQVADIRNFIGFKSAKVVESLEIEEEVYHLTERDLLKLVNKTGFTKADFKANENDNDHSLNAIMLARAFGSSQEFKDMIDIDKRHKQRGHITEPDYTKRNALVKKYYSRLK